MKHKTIRQIYKNTTEILNKEIDLGVIPTAKYSQKDHLKVLLSAALENTSAESISDEVEGFPSADTVLGNLRDQEWKTIKNGFDRIIRLTVERAKRRRWFRRAVTLAIDFHDDLYYGKVGEWVVGTKPQKGTCYAFRIATIDVVEYGKRFTLAVMPIKKGMKRADIVRDLINEARRYVKIKCVLLDGGFYGTKVVISLRDLGIKFIITEMMRSDKIKESVKAAGYEDVQIEHIIKGGDRDFVKVHFVSHYNPRKERRVNYITNTNLDPERACQIHSKRWGIETGYRVKGKFEANTTSSSFVIRLTYLLLSVCLYNLWVLINLVIDGVIVKLIECSEMDGKKYTPSITTRSLKKQYISWLCSC